MRVPTTLSVAVLFVAAACGGGEASEGEAPVSETIEEIDEVTGVDTLDEEGTPPQRVMVRATSFDFEPSSVVVGAGTVRFVVTNAADVPHGFEVEGHGMEEAIGTIDPGSTDSLTVTLETPGDYTIYCPVGDHRERGMTGTLTVE